MKLKTYKSAQAAAAFLVAMSIASGIIVGQYFIPAALLVAATLILLLLRKRVTEPVADERDIATMGKAAALTIRGYSWIAVVVMLLLYANRAENPAFEPVAMTLAYSTALLMILYSFLFKYYNRFKWTDHKWAFILTTALLVLVVLVMGMRFLSGEDGWICRDGQWVAHGHPETAKPQGACPAGRGI